MAKTCNNCGQHKDFGDFYAKPRAVQDNYVESAAGYSHQCKACDKKARSAYVADNPNSTKTSDRKQHLKRYGLTIEGYNALFAAQNGSCPGCSRHQSDIGRSLCVDHDHKTGKVRGLLCHSCNSLLGMAKDKTETLASLIKYLINSTESEVQTDTKVG